MLEEYEEMGPRSPTQIARYRAMGLRIRIEEGVVWIHSLDRPDLGGRPPVYPEPRQRSVHTRFTASEWDVIGQRAVKSGVPKTIFIHDTVMAAVGKKGRA